MILPQFRTPLLVAYPVEIWPYNLRSRGLTVTWVTTILAIFFNTFINPIALGAIGWKYYFVFVVLCALYGITAYFFYPETRGHSLEQMAVVFDGDDASAPAPDQIARKSVISDGYVEKGIPSTETDHVEMKGV